MALIVGLAAAGAGLIWYGTVWGPWAFSDGVGYMVNARNLLLGRGLGLYRASGDFILLITHPPLYPLLLFGLGKTGMNLIAAARWVDIALFGCFLLIGGWGFFRLTHSGWIAVAFTAVLLVHPALLLAYLSAMSEPLFLICILSSLLLLAAYVVQDGRSRAILILSGVAAAGALLTRYPGAALILTGVFALWVFPRWDWRQRARDSLIYLAIAVAPTLTFVAWTRWVLGSRVPRGLKTSIDLLSLARNFAVQALDSIWNWKPVPPDVIPNTLIPENYTRPVAAGLGIILGAALVWSMVVAFRSRAVQPAGERLRLDGRPAALFLLFLLAYLGFVAAAYVVTFPTPDIDERTLLPLLPAGLLLGFALMDLVVRLAPASRLLKGTLVGIVGLSLMGWSIISQDTVIGLHRTGLGYTSRAWQASETMAAIKQLPPDLSLVSNETAAILLYTNRSAYEIPGLRAGDSQLLSVPFGSSDSDLDRAYQDSRAALIIFNTLNRQLKSGPEAAQQLTAADLTGGLTVVFEGKDGAIYCRCGASTPALPP